MKRILVVDDERCIADTLAAILRNFGYEASACYDAQSALRECASRTPDLIISDVMMPGLNGIDMAVRIRQNHEACKILLFSGLGSSFDLLEETRLQGYDFDLLTKPVHPAELLRKVESELGIGLLPQDDERSPRSSRPSAISSSSSTDGQRRIASGRVRSEATQ